MPSLGNLYVTLGAKTDALDQGIVNAKKSLNDLSGVARTTVKSIALLSAASITAGAGIIAGLVNSGRQAIDMQAKLAQSLDGTIGGLRAAEMAAGDAGVATEEFYGAASRMNQALGDATKQAGPAYDALTNLGVSAQHLLSLDIDQRFAEIADAMARQNITGARAQDIMRDLGVRNAQLANLMRQGGDAFREQADEVDRLGLRLSMVDAAQVEMANDAIGIFGDVLTGVQDQLTVAAAPYLTVLSEKFREAAIESEGFKSQTDSAIKAIITGLAKAADFVHGLGVVWKGAEVVVIGFAAAVMTALEFAIKGINKLTGDALKDLGDLGRALQVLPGAAGMVGDALAAVGSETSLDDVIDGAEGARVALSKANSELHNMAMNHGEYSKTAVKYLDEVAAASVASATKVVEARKTMAGGGGVSAGVDTGSKSSQDQYGKDMGAWIKQQEAELEAIKGRYMTEEELNRQHQETMAMIGNEFDAAKFESEAQWRSIREQAEAEHLQRMSDMNRSAYDGIQNLIASRWGNAAAPAAGAMKSILGTMATQSRKAFEISKAWAIGDALVSTYQGIAKGVSKGFAGIPEVAWAAATGFAQVSAIKNQSFGGAGGAAASGGGQPGTAPNPIGVGGQSSGQGQSTTYRFEGLQPGSFVSSDMVVQILKQAQTDGALRGNIMFA